MQKVPQRQKTNKQEDIIYRVAANHTIQGTKQQQQQQQKQKEMESKNVSNVSGDNTLDIRLLF